jgi:hypothetical protein
MKAEAASILSIYAAPRSPSNSSEHESSAGRKDDIFTSASVPVVGSAAAIACASLYQFSCLPTPRR